LSNEEIIEILGQMREPRNIQRFLSKIFEGIDNLSFQANGEVTAMHSKEGETVKLVQTVMANDSAENWLRNLEAVMKTTIKAVVYQTLQDKFKNKQYQEWVKMWPGQIVLLVTDILFTKDMDELMKKNDISKIQDIHKEIVDEIDVLTSMVRSKITDVHRTTMSSLITTRVHDRDQVQNMMKESRVSKTPQSDFIWQMYMKFYYEPVEDPETMKNSAKKAVKKEENIGEGEDQPNEYYGGQHNEEEEDKQDEDKNEDDENADLKSNEPSPNSSKVTPNQNQSPQSVDYKISVEKEKPVLNNIRVTLLNA
jgi:hypothetical protein